MKTKNKPLILLCFLFTLSLHAQKTMSFLEAQQKGLIELGFRGAFDMENQLHRIDNDGLHFGKCIFVYVNNLSKDDLTLNLDCGTQLFPEDTSIQTMIVTKEIICSLMPNDEFVANIYAMCGQIHDAAPTKYNLFKVGKLADEKTVKIAKYIETNQIQNLIGQDALWAYRDNATKHELINYGADSTTLRLTKEILYNLEITTDLNPPKKKITKKKSTDIVLSFYTFWIGLSAIIFILVLLLFVIFRKSRNKK